MKKNLTSILLAGSLLTGCFGNGKSNEKETSNDYASYIAQFEGRRNEVYDPNPNDGRDEPTIGIGHYLDRGDSKETFAKILPEVNYDNIYCGKEKLTNEQIDKLFNHDVIEYENLAKKYFSNFDSYPFYLKRSLVDGCYRGDLSDSPKTRKLINEGKFYAAADEYINRKDYRECVKNGMIGIKTRMDKNRDAMIKYARELEGRGR